MMVAETGYNNSQYYCHIFHFQRKDCFNGCIVYTFTFTHLQNVRRFGKGLFFSYLLFSVFSLRNWNGHLFSEYLEDTN